MKSSSARKQSRDGQNGGFALQNEAKSIVTRSFCQFEFSDNFSSSPVRLCILLRLKVNKISPSVFHAWDSSLLPQVHTYRRIGVSIFSLGKYGTVTRVRISQQTIFPPSRIKSIFLKIVFSFPRFLLSLSLVCPIHPR